MASAYAVPSVSIVRPAPGVAGVLRRADRRTAAELHPAERELADALNGARRRDFVAGRHAAADAMRLLGRSGPVLRDGPRPRFPPGVHGSVSHCQGGAAAALAGVGPRIAGVGVDVERLGRLNPRTARLVLTPRERAGLLREPADAALLTVAFSAKEAAYKALCGLAAERDLVFHSVEIRVLGARLHIEAAHGLLPPEHRIAGQAHFDGPYVWTTVLVTADRVQAGERAAAARTG
ncbi:4'-phosphopantetheinyl transferase superfamily protein [Streptomyces sp. NPDC050610]|uniref:4'-phosphopantetheinyl transferase family protein n=1 Tax=Streptomyces sp. NPDC050610 TaxID=3157097 RepID=UPI00344418DC